MRLHNFTKLPFVKLIMGLIHLPRRFVLALCVRLFHRLKYIYLVGHVEFHEIFQQAEHKRRTISIIIGTEL